MHLIIGAEHGLGYDVPILSAARIVDRAEEARGDGRSYRRPSGPCREADEARAGTPIIAHPLKSCFGPNRMRVGGRPSMSSELHCGFDTTWRAPSNLTIAELDAVFVGDFLDHLERARRNAARSRNARLAALHAFFRYVAITEPALMDPLVWVS